LRGHILPDFYALHRSKRNQRAPIQINVRLFKQFSLVMIENPLHAAAIVSSLNLIQLLSLVRERAGFHFVLPDNLIGLAFEAFSFQFLAPHLHRGVAGSLISSSAVARAQYHFWRP